MAISVTLINSIVGNATLTLGTGVPAGVNIIVGVYQSGATTAGSLTDTVNGAYTAIPGQGTSGITECFYFENSAAIGSGQSIHLTTGTGAGNWAISAFYATGLASSGSYDAAVTAGADATTVTSNAASVAGELFVALVGGFSGSAVATFTQDTGNGWAAPPPVSRSAGGTTRVILTGGNQVNAGTSAITFAPTVTNFGTPHVQIVGFKPAAGGTTYNVSITEAGSATETITGFISTADSIAETGTLTDFPAATGNFGVVAAEAGSLSDLVSNIATLPAALSEFGTLADFPTATGTFGETIGEAGFLIDFPDTAVPTFTDFFSLYGGQYGITCCATAFNAGLVELDIMTPDQESSVSTGASFSDGGLAMVDLPPGQYRFMIFAAANVSLSVSRVVNRRMP